MKPMKIFKKSVLVVAVGLLSYSCNLDLLPTTAIPKSETFTKVSDAQYFENGIASHFRSSQHNVFSQTSDFQTDMFNATVEFSNYYSNIHQGNTNFTTGEYEVRDVWRQAYKTIMATNNLLDNIDNIPLDIDPTTAASQRATLNVLKGRAYFYRAATYHFLVKHFAPDYEPSTAATDLGVPLEIVYNVESTPARATVAATYAQITADITEARTLLAGVAGAVRSIVPTIDAVNALDARVQLCMHNYSGAATLAGNLIDGGKYTLANTAALMTAEWVNDNGPEDIFQMFASLTEYGQAQLGSGSAYGRMSNDLYLRWNTTQSKYVPYYIPTQAVVDSYETSDLRKAEWLPVLTAVLSATDYQLHLLNKYSGNPALFTSPNRNYSHKPKIFRIAEMYLIRAEALLLQASPDAAGALTALNALQTARGATLTAATLENVQTEWAKETIGEGMRLECLKRWHIGFSRGTPQNTDAVVRGTYFDEKVAPANDFRFNWPIPAIDMMVNKNLVQNTGW